MPAPREVVIISTVGTSIFSNLEKEFGNQSYYCEGSDPTYKTMLGEPVSSMGDKAEMIEKFNKDIRYRDVLGKKLANEKAINVFSPYFAEIHSITKILENLRGKVDLCRLYFLYSATIGGQMAASLLHEVLTNIGSFEKMKLSLEEPVMIEDLVLNEPEPARNERRKRKIFNGINNLIEKVYSLVGHGEHRTVLNITGGFKAIPPYLTILGMLMIERNPHLTIQYLYEDSQDIITLPLLPINFDLLTWRDYRGYINSLGSMPAKSEFACYILESLPEKIRFLFNASGETIELTEFGRILQQEYQAKKNQDMTPYGRGELLLQSIEDAMLREYLQARIPEWHNAWLGDRLPEMIEHSRGHAQRLLETACQLLTPLLSHGKDISEKVPELLLGSEEIAALTGAIWLHDIGHSYDVFYAHSKLASQKERRRIQVSSFPHLHREYHNFLSYHLLKHESFKEHYLPSFLKENELEVDKRISGLTDVIAFIAKYHRKKMPLFRHTRWEQILNSGFGPLKLEVEPLDALVPEDGPIDRDKLLFLTGLFRLIDASDVQHERIETLSYRAMKMKQIARDIFLLVEEYEMAISETCGKEVIDNVTPPFSYFFESFNSFVSGMKTQNFDPEYIKNIDKDIIEKLNAQSYTAIAALFSSYFAGEVSETGKVVGEALLEKVLSLASRVVFKVGQALHYRKYDFVQLVYYRLDEVKLGSGTEIFTYTCILVYDNDAGRERAEKICGEIREEYEYVKDILRADAFILEFRFAVQGSEDKEIHYLESMEGLSML